MREPRPPASRGTASEDAEPAAIASAAGSDAAETAPAAVPTARMIKVVVPGATGVTTRCGQRNGAGTTSLVVRDAPLGTCVVEAVVGGATLRGGLTVTEPAAFSCQPDQEVLTCS